MSPQLPVTPVLCDPFALIDATAHFVIQLLIAKHPEMLLPHDDQHPLRFRIIHPPQLLFDAVRELQYAIEVYRACLPDPAVGGSDPDLDDDFPF